MLAICNLFAHLPMINIDRMLFEQLGLSIQKNISTTEVIHLKNKAAVWKVVARFTLFTLLSQSLSILVNISQVLFCRCQDVCGLYQQNISLICQVVFNLRPLNTVCFNLFHQAVSVTLIMNPVSNLEPNYKNLLSLNWWN